LTLIATQGLTGTIPDTAGGGIYVGSAQPSSSLTNKVWFVVDGNGRPLGVKLFYNGSWRPMYSGAIGDIKMFAGGTSGQFDGTGRGVVGSWHDGWAICNGLNGTQNLLNRFVVGGNWDGSWWATTVEGSSTYSGGAGTLYIQPANLPPLYAEVAVHSNGGGSASGSILGGGTDPIQDYTVVGVNRAPLQGLPLTNCPPYVSLGFLQFIGYA